MKKWIILIIMVIMMFEVEAFKSDQGWRGTNTAMSTYDNSSISSSRISFLSNALTGVSDLGTSLWRFWQRIAYLQDNSNPEISNILNTTLIGEVPYDNNSIVLNATVTETNKDSVWLYTNITGDFENITNIENFTINGDVYSYFIDSGNFTTYDTIEYIWYANDSSGRETASSLYSFFIPNRKSVIGSNQVAITPDPAIDTDDLNCSVGIKYDYDKGGISGVYYHWYNTSGGSDVLLTDVNTDASNLSAGNFSTNDMIKCGAIPYDLFENGTEVQSQVVTIGSSNAAPLIILANATTQNTTLISDSTNPTNNNSAVHFEVGFTDSADALDDGFTAYFCKTDSFTYPETCNGGAWASNTSNTTQLVLSGDYEITSSETLSSYNFYAFVVDNLTVSSSSLGTFNVNHPPTLANITMDNGTKYNSLDINITIESTEPDSDSVTNYVYIDDGNGNFNLNGTTNEYGYNFTNFIDALNYTVFVETLDAHNYSGGNSSQIYFQTDYTIPNNTIVVLNYANTPTGQTAELNLSTEDNTGLDSCYFKFTSSGGLPTSYTKLDCNNLTYLDSTNLTQPVPYTYRVQVFTNDTFGNENESNIVEFTATKQVTQPSGGGGGGGGGAAELKALNETCLSDSECISALCDLSITSSGIKSNNYGTCQSTLCGNGLLDEGENFVNCESDAGLGAQLESDRKGFVMRALLPIGGIAVMFLLLPKLKKKSKKSKKNRILNINIKK